MTSVSWASVSITLELVRPSSRMRVTSVEVDGLFGRERGRCGGGGQRRRAGTPAAARRADGQGGSSCWFLSQKTNERQDINPTASRTGGSGASRAARRTGRARLSSSPVRWYPRTVQSIAAGGRSGPDVRAHAPQRHPAPRRSAAEVGPRPTARARGAGSGNRGPPGRRPSSSPAPAGPTSSEWNWPSRPPPRGRRAAARRRRAGLVAGSAGGGRAAPAPARGRPSSWPSWNRRRPGARVVTAGGAAGGAEGRHRARLVVVLDEAGAAVLERRPAAAGGGARRPRRRSEQVVQLLVVGEVETLLVQRPPAPSTPRPGTGSRGGAPARPGWLPSRSCPTGSGPSRPSQVARRRRAARASPCRSAGRRTARRCGAGSASCASRPARLAVVDLRGVGPGREIGIAPVGHDRPLAAPEEGAGSRARSSSVPRTKASGCSRTSRWSRAVWLGTKSRIRRMPWRGQPRAETCSAAGPPISSATS